MNSDNEDEIPDLVDLSNFTPTSTSLNIDDITMGSKKIIPITILTGFLGSGKTTLLSFILTAQHGRRIAVIENELSMGLGIESIIAKSGVSGSNIDGFFELNNGCICCTSKDSLLSTLEQLSKHTDRFDYIIIEMTGVANPGPVITNFWLDDSIHSVLKLDGIICIVDGSNIEKYLQSSDTEYDVKMQICYADRILLNKCDLISLEHAKSIEAILVSMNSLADIKQTSFSRVPSIDWILNIDGYATRLETLNIRGLFDQPLENSYPNMSTSDLSGNYVCAPCNSSYVQPLHSATVLSTHAIIFDGLLQLMEVQRFLDSILYEDTSDYTSDYKSHHVNSDVLHKIRSSNQQIYRMKGILHFTDQENLYVLQSVHDTFDIRATDIGIGSNLDTTEGLNKIVIIGKNINESAVREGFLQCIQHYLPT